MTKDPLAERIDQLLGPQGGVCTAPERSFIVRWPESVFPPPGRWLAGALFGTTSALLWVQCWIFLLAGDPLDLSSCISAFGPDVEGLLQIAAALFLFGGLPLLAFGCVQPWRCVGRLRPDSIPPGISGRLVEVVCSTPLREHVWRGVPMTLRSNRAYAGVLDVHDSWLRFEGMGCRFVIQGREIASLTKETGFGGVTVAVLSLKWPMADVESIAIEVHGAITAYGIWKARRALLADLAPLMKAVRAAQPRR